MIKGTDTEAPKIILRSRTRIRRCLQYITRGAEFVGDTEVGTDIAITDIEYGFVRI